MHSCSKLTQNASRTSTYLLLVCMAALQAAATHDGDGHGTHCLGTILGRPVDGVRIGVAAGITDVLIAKVVPEGANGTSFMLVKALLWAWEQGANIINISLAYDLVSKTEQLMRQNKPRREAENAVHQMLAENLKCLECVMALLQQKAVRPPPLVIAACGNGSSAASKMHVYLPAAAEGVMSVAAAAKSSQGLKVAAFSNVGAKVCGPGVGVCSAAAGSTSSGAPLLKVLSGTSMAAPHVAGVAALWWEQARIKGIPENALAEWVAVRLEASAIDEGFASGYDMEAVGSGLVQAPPK
jgi:subtilisin family serine protease